MNIWQTYLLGWLLIMFPIWMVAMFKYDKNDAPLSTLVGSALVLTVLSLMVLSGVRILYLMSCING